VKGRTEEVRPDQYREAGEEKVSKAGPGLRRGRSRGAGSVTREECTGPALREGAVRVSEVQRARILAAMVRVVAEDGVGSASVSKVVKRAGVSRRTFYELFDSGEDCFLAVFEEIVARASRVASETAVAAGVSAVWHEQVRAGLGALLLFFEEEPALGRLLVVDALGAGPRVLECRAGVLETLAGIVDRGRVEAGSGRGKALSLSASPLLIAEGMVGAVLAVIHARMTRQDEHGALPELLSSLMGMIVLPYLGQAVAVKELARPVPESAHRRASSSERAVASARSGRRGDVPSDPLDGLEMRLTYRTLMVLSVIASEPGASNRSVGEAAGIHDQGQISKLLGRLGKLGLIENNGAGQPKGESNAWTLSQRGQEVQNALGTER
jgi:AcrR family transcriptional regulator